MGAYDGWLTLDEYDAAMDDFRLAVARLVLEVDRFGAYCADNERIERFQADREEHRA